MILHTCLSRMLWFRRLDDFGIVIVLSEALTCQRFFSEASCWLVDRI
jgi:hypothetical protein